MNLANKISIGRILLVPAIVASLVYYHPARDALRFVTLWLFLLAIASDAVDGLIARSQRQESPLGTLLDPIADKCLILGTLISLSAIHGLPEWMRVPAWFNLIVISRDVILLAGAAVLFLMKGRWTVQPSRLGKWTTALQMAVVLAVLLRLQIREPLLVSAAGLTILSGLNYVRRGVQLLG